ncbi:unnamed protein product [Urochloa humidicola]
MASSDAAADDEVTFELLPFIRLYKSGRVERLIVNESLPASLLDASGVASKDVTIDPATNVSVRLYLPPIAAAGAAAKLPVVVYFHGGGFMVESADSAPYHRYLNALTARAGAVVVSVDYRRVPEHRLPAGAVAGGARGPRPRVPGRRQCGRQHRAQRRHARRRRLRGAPGSDPGRAAGAPLLLGRVEHHGASAGGADPPGVAVHDGEPRRRDGRPEAVAGVGAGVAGADAGGACAGGRGGGGFPGGEGAGLPRGAAGQRVARRGQAGGDARGGSRLPPPEAGVGGRREVNGSSGAFSCSRLIAQADYPDADLSLVLRARRVTDSLWSVYQE